MKKKSERSIDFTKIDWKSIDDERLQFYFNQAVEANDSILTSINNINDKTNQFLAIASALLAALTGFLLDVWEKPEKTATVNAMLCGCIGLGLIIVALLIALFPRTVYPGKATPDIMFSGNLYKEPMIKHFADGIASYHQYILLNRKVAKFRRCFLLIGMGGFLLVPLTTIALLLWVF